MSTPTLISIGSLLLALLPVLVASVIALGSWQRQVTAQWEAAYEAAKERLDLLERQFNDLESHARSLQRRVDSLTRHNRRLVAALEAAGIPVPEPNGEEVL